MIIIKIGGVKVFDNYNNHKLYVAHMYRGFQITYNCLSFKLYIMLTKQHEIKKLNSREGD